MTIRGLITILTLSVVLVSCSEYNKVLKSTDYNLKYEKALEYYKKKDWTRAQALLEEILPLVRITSKGEDAYYKYCYTHYYLKDYYLASYYFKNFSKLYPAGEKAEECLFMSGLCNLRNSPKWSLDQTETYEAIKDLQAFLDKYPESPKKDTCNKIIDNLYYKLQVKSFENAKLYYKIQNYKSASIALKSMLDKYPTTPFKEEALFLIIKSDYFYAEMSIPSKKTERYEQTIKSYTTFVSSFPESKRRKEADKINEEANEKIKHKQVQ